MFEVLHQKAIILASASEPRKRLLRSLGLRFESIPADIDETAIKQPYSGDDLSILAQQLSNAKALKVSQNYPDAFVIGADQLCVFEQCIFGKPHTHQRAMEHLRQLQGNSHQQICAMSIAHHGSIVWQAVDIVYLWMRKLSDSVIEHYLQTEQPYQSCGAYHFEGMGKWLFEQVEGSDTSIQGLALTLLINGLIECGAVELN